MGSSRYALFPRLCRIPANNFSNVVSSLDLPSLGLENLGNNAHGPKFIFFAVDNHSANRKAMAHVVTLLSCFVNIFIGIVVCFSHVLSNSAKWGNSAFPTCDILRLTHFLKCRPIANLDSLVSKMILPGSIDKSAFFVGSANILWINRWANSSSLGDTVFYSFFFKQNTKLDGLPIYQ